MKTLNPIRISGKEMLPLIEGGKGISISNGQSSGAWAACGGAGTFSAVNADSYDGDGFPIPQNYSGRTRRERNRELISYAIEGGITQAQIAHDYANGQGRLHMNVLWEMAGAEEVLHGVLQGAKGLIHGVTCGAGMPYRLSAIAAGYEVYFYPIVSSARAFRALWKRAYHKQADWLGGVVYEDPWRAGGHNGLSNSEDPEIPEDPYPRVQALRRQMQEFGLAHVPIIMAGGVWCLHEWENWLDNPDLGLIAFQFGTRPLLTQESPISDAWKKRLVTLQQGDVFLNRFSPTGFYSSAVSNHFLNELQERSERQIPYTSEACGEHITPLAVGARGRLVYVAIGDKERADTWFQQGFTEALKTPDSTLIFLEPTNARQIQQDQVDCMGCLSKCLFSNWYESEPYFTGKRADPRSFCIQKTLQKISHSDSVEDQLMFAGHNAYRFADDPFYANGFIPTVQELIDRILTGT